MMRESRVDPQARNPNSGAVGLIQFLPSTLARLGWAGTPDDFRALSAEEQLPWVKKFLLPSTRYGLGDAARVYQAIFMPASLRLGAGPQTALIDSKGVYADRYQPNRPLDIDGDGRITICEAAPGHREVPQRRSMAGDRAEVSRHAGRPGGHRPAGHRPEPAGLPSAHGVAP